MDEQYFPPSKNNVNINLNLTGYVTKDYLNAPEKTLLDYLNKKVESMKD